jgi:hypothetical protein
MHSRPISCAELREHYEAVMQNARIFLRVRDFENGLALYRSKQRRFFLARHRSQLVHQSRDRAPGLVTGNRPAHP